VCVSAKHNITHGFLVRRLHVTDIDSERMFVHIHHGKGAKDRFVPLPQRTLQILRDHWLKTRNPLLLFPAPGRGNIHASTSEKPLPDTSIQIPFKQACCRAKINKPVSVRHLRHAYVTSGLISSIYPV